MATVTIDGSDWPVDEVNWSALADWKIATDGRIVTAAQKTAVYDAFRRLATGDIFATNSEVNPSKSVPFFSTLADAFNPSKSVAFQSAKDTLAKAGAGLADTIKAPLATANRTILVVAVSAGVLGVAFIVSKLVRR
jgi:hypothetical protein